MPLSRAHETSATPASTCTSHWPSRRTRIQALKAPTEGLLSPRRLHLHVEATLLDSSPSTVTQATREGRLAARCGPSFLAAADHAACGAVPTCSNACDRRNLRISRVERRVPTGGSHARVPGAARARPPGGRARRQDASAREAFRGRPFPRRGAGALSRAEKIQDRLV